jgi:hypothetical protein
MSFNISTLDHYSIDTGSALKYWEADDQLQTAVPTMKKLGSAVIFGLALSAGTMDVPSYVRLSNTQRTALDRAYDSGLNSPFKAIAVGTYAEQMDPPPLSKSVRKFLNAAGVDTIRASAIIKFAQSSLLSMGYPVLKIEAKNLNDPEEDSNYVIINLLVSASFEKALELDSTLARIIVKNFANIPPAFNVTVTEAA